MASAARPHPETEMAERFTAKQGQCLAFIYNYSVMFGQGPAEADLQRFFGTSPPAIHQMLVALTEKGWISRIPGMPRSIQLLVDPEEIPRLERPPSRRA
jgi:repressor LexA